MKEKMEIGIRKINEIQTKQVKNFIRSKPSTAGITLIALVITIIILLILVAVSIATLTGENGILTQASTARDKTKEGELKERAKLILTNWNFEKGTGKTFEEYLNEHFNTVVNNGDGTYTVTLEEYETIVDEDGNVTIKGEGQGEEKIKPTDIYVTLYTDGTLGFSNDETTIEGKTVQESYGNIKGIKFDYTNYPPWKSNNNVTTANIANKIVPTDTGFWFYSLRNLTNIENMSNLLTDNVTNMDNMFRECKSLTSLDVSNFNTKNVTSMQWMFQECSGLRSLDVTNFDTSNVTNMNSIFYECSGLTSLDVTHFNTSNITIMSNMFSYCRGLTSLDVSNFDTSDVTSMSSMFSGCSSLTSLDVTHFDTSNVISMGSMFDGCSSLTSLDVTHFDTSNVTNMNNMFQECSDLTSLDVSSFNTSNLTSMYGMFYRCSSLTDLDVSTFNTNNVTSMGAMFQKCSGLTSLNLSHFNTSNVTNMNNIFQDCEKLAVIYADKEKFVISESTETSNMFTNCATNLFVSKLDNTLFGYKIEKGKGWSGEALVSRTGHNGRASVIDVLRLDSTKTYTITMNNTTNYYYGVNGLNDFNNKIYDSLWVAPNKATTITNTKRIVLNFKYQSGGTTTITDDMVNEIMSSFTITMVD